MLRHALRVSKSMLNQAVEEKEAPRSHYFRVPPPIPNNFPDRLTQTPITLQSKIPT